MIVRILTDRPEDYAFLEGLYDKAVQFRYTSAGEPLTDPDRSSGDIVVADPKMDGLEQLAGSVMKKRMLAGKPFIICGPERVKGLVRELKAAGLEPGGSRESVCPEEELQGREEEEDPYRRKEYRPRTEKPFRLRIGLIGLNDGAGAGILTMLLAEELASQSFENGRLVTVYAPGEPYFYRALSLGKDLPGERFREIGEMAQPDESTGSDQRETLNVVEGISWVVASGSHQDDPAWDREKSLEMMEQIEGNYLLLPFRQFPSDMDSELLKASLDVLLVITDPRPSALLSGLESLEEIRKTGIPPVFVISHMNEAVKTEQVLNFLETDDAVLFPELSAADLCTAEYKGENPNRIDAVRKQTMTPVCDIIDQLMRLCGGTGKSAVL